MNIHSQQNGKCSYQSFKALPTNYKRIPESVAKLGKIVGEYVNSPEQKLFLATSALMFQPLVDLKFAEEDKKIDTSIKSASKAIAGGLTGVPIRALCIAFMKRFVQPKDLDIYMTGEKVSKLSDKIKVLLYPLENLDLRSDPERLVEADLRLKQYNNTMGTVLAILFMLAFSNSKIDVPVTSFIQDFLSKVIKEKKPVPKAFAEVATDRKKKIDAWCDKKKASLNNVVSRVKPLFSPPKESNDVKKAPGVK